MRGFVLSWDSKAVDSSALRVALSFVMERLIIS